MSEPTIKTEEHPSIADPPETAPEGRPGWLSTILVIASIVLLTMAALPGLVTSARWVSRYINPPIQFELSTTSSQIEVRDPSSQELLATISAALTTDVAGLPDTLTLTAPDDFASTQLSIQGDAENDDRDPIISQAEYLRAGTHSFKLAGGILQNCKTPNRPNQTEPCTIVHIQLGQYGVRATDDITVRLIPLNPRGTGD